MSDSWEDALSAVQSERFSPRRSRTLLALLVLLLALAGPWAYSADGVPPPAWCAPPYILLTADRCVRHVPGGEIMAYAAMGPVAVGGLIAGEYSSTLYLAMALLLMVLTVLAYARCRRQDRQLAILLGGTTLLFVPAGLDHLTWQPGTGGIEWLVPLWAWMVALLLPLLALPVQWTSQSLGQLGQNKE